MNGINTSGCEVRESAVLVLRGFADRALGMGTLACMESELQSMEEEGLLDSRALMRGAVKNKNARHNNVIADFEQAPCIEKGQGTVVSFAKYDALERMRKAAAKWMDQEHPLVAEQNRYYVVLQC